MNYTFPVNKQDILLNAGFSILWQCMDLDDDSKIVKDNQKSLMTLSSKISKENTSASSEFHKVASSFVSVANSRPLQPKTVDVDTPAVRRLSSMPVPQGHKQKGTKKQLQAIAARFSSFSAKEKPEEQQHKRRGCPPQSGAHPAVLANLRTNSSLSLISTQSAPVLQSSTPSPRLATATRPIGPAASSVVNLDFFPLDTNTHSHTTSHNSSTTMLPPRKPATVSSDTTSNTNSNSWEHLMPDPDLLIGDLYGSTVEPLELNKCISNPETLDWTGDMWPFVGFDLGPRAHVPQSLLSFSEESMTSGDEFMFSAAGSMASSNHDGAEMEMMGDETFKGIAMPVSSIEDDVDFGGEIKV